MIASNSIYTRSIVFFKKLWSLFCFFGFFVYLYFKKKRIPSTLVEASLVEASLVEASLVEASLVEASLVSGDWLMVMGIGVLEGDEVMVMGMGVLKGGQEIY